MRPIQHTSNNGVLVGEPGVAPLPVTQVVYKHPVNPAMDERGVVSYWLPNQKEREAIAQGKPVLLSFIGQTHPPVRVGVDGVE